MSLPKRKAVLFTFPNTAEPVDIDHANLGGDGVLCKNEVSAVSAGTKDAMLLDMPNLTGKRTPDGTFPKLLCYSGFGMGEEVGDNVESIQIDARVLPHWGSSHSNHNYIAEGNLLKIDHPGLASEHAVFAAISECSLNGPRKTRSDLSGSGSVFATGILVASELAWCRKHSVERTQRAYLANQAATQ